jgi:hypothetical protein
MEYHQCKDLERQRDELRQNLETQKKGNLLDICTYILTSLFFSTLG